jgi:hypothetical protein
MTPQEWRAGQVYRVCFFKLKWVGILDKDVKSWLIFSGVFVLLTAVFMNALFMIGFLFGFYKATNSYLKFKKANKV